MNKLLIIDDDAKQSDFLKSILGKDFAVTAEGNPLKALALAKQSDFNAVIVDVHMPIMSGLDFVKRLRTQNTGSLPVFILSSDKSYETRIGALNLKIKDFLYPEMSKEELIIRIKNHLHLSVATAHELKYKDIQVDPLSLSVYANFEKIEVTLTEFKLIKFLITNSNKFINKQDLKNEVWSNAIVTDKTLNSHLTNLRAKLSSSTIQLKSDKLSGVILY